jgi:hypothetical protein
VNGTVVTGITADAFDTSELTFISAQTDPVAAPERSLFWFKRGEGQLYIWDSAQRNPSAGVTGYSAIACGIGPRVETVGRIGNQVEKGHVFFPGNPAAYYLDQDSLTHPYRLTPQWNYNPGSTGTSNVQGYDAMFVSSDTGQSYAYVAQVPMVIRGFVDVMAHSGITCLPTQRAVVAIRSDNGLAEEFAWIRSSAHHSADSLSRYLGMIVGTLGQAEAGLVKIYKVGCPDTTRR